MAGLALLVASGGLPQASAAAEITVFAAASLKTALDRAAADWQAATGDIVVISYGGSAALARQIEQGAPADLFVSAAADWMDVLDAAGLIRPGSRRDLWGNTLVLVASGPVGSGPVGSGKAAALSGIGPGFDLAGRLAGGKLAMGLVTSVPAGQYGKQALESLGLWASVQGSVVQSDNVRAALALVALGEAPYGIVYASDAVAEPRVSVVGRFAPDSHPPILYPGAIITDSQVPEAVDFLSYLASPAVGALFTDQGFTVLKPAE